MRVKNQIKNCTKNERRKNRLKILKHLLRRKYRNRK